MSSLRASGVFFLQASTWGVPDVDVSLSPYDKQLCAVYHIVPPEITALDWVPTHTQGNKERTKCE